MQVCKVIQHCYLPTQPETRNLPADSVLSVTVVYKRLAQVECAQHKQFAASLPLQPQSQRKRDKASKLGTFVSFKEWGKYKNEKQNDRVD